MRILKFLKKLFIKSKIENIYFYDESDLKKQRMIKNILKNIKQSWGFSRKEWKFIMTGKTKDVRLKYQQKQIY